MQPQKEYKFNDWCNDHNMCEGCAAQEVCKEPCSYIWQSWYAFCFMRGDKVVRNGNSSEKIRE